VSVKEVFGEDMDNSLVARFLRLTVYLAYTAYAWSWWQFLSVGETSAVYQSH